VQKNLQDISPEDELTNWQCFDNCPLSKFRCSGLQLQTFFCKPVQTMHESERKWVLPAAMEFLAWLCSYGACEN